MLDPDQTQSYNDTSSDEILNLEQYTRVRDGVADLLDRLVDTTSTLGLQESAERLIHTAARLRKGVFTLLVLGDFKTGKSSFLNALLETDLLPTAVTPCTAVLATIHFADKPEVIIHRFDGSSEVIGMEQFTADFCLSTDEANNAQFDSVEQVELRLPSALCRNGVTIVDSPGLDESPRRTAITTSHIPHSDAAIFMMGADRLGRDHEMEYLRTHILGHGLDHVFFVINRCDVIEDSLDPDHEWKMIRARSWDLLGPKNAGPYKDQNLSDYRIYFLSATQARQAQQTGNNQQLIQSGLPTLQSALTRFLARDRGRVAIQRPANLGMATIAVIRQSIDYRIHLMDIGLQELDRRIEETQPDFERIQRARSQAEGIISRQKDRCQAELSVSLREKVAELQDNMRRVVRHFDFPGADSVGGRLTASLKPETIQKAVATQLDRYLSTEISVWVKASELLIAQRLEETTGQLGDSARQVYQSLTEIHLKVVGPQVEKSTAEQFQDPVERLMALSDSLRQGNYGVVLKETEAIWKGTARTLAAQFAGYMLLGMLGLAANPVAAITTMISVAAGMTLYNSNLAIDQLRNSVADIARTQLAEAPDRALPELNRQVNAVFETFQGAYLEAIDTLVGQEWSILKGIRDEKDEKRHQSALQRTELDKSLAILDQTEKELQRTLKRFD